MRLGKQASLNTGLALVLAGAALLILTAFFLAIYVQQPRPRTQIGGPPEMNAIAGWMTVRYISRVYHVPEPVLLSALNITETEARGQSLDQLARRRHETVQQVVLIVRSTVEQYRSQPSARAAFARAAGLGISGAAVR